MDFSDNPDPLPAHTGDSEDIWGYLASSSAVDLDFMSHNLSTPTSMAELQQHIRYWQDLANPEAFGDTKESRSVLPSEREKAIAEIIDVLQAMATVPPQGEEEQRLRDVFTHFESTMNEMNYPSLFFRLADEGPIANFDSVPSSHKLVNADMSGYYSRLEDIETPIGFNLMELDRELELFFGFDCSSPLSKTSYSPRSSRSKSSSPCDGKTDDHEDLSSSSNGGDYTCSEKSCRQSFKRANALQRHVASIHERRGQKCPFCPNGKRAFNRSDNFQRHVTGRHKSIQADNTKLQACLQRLYQGNGRRTSWKK